MSIDVGNSKRESWWVTNSTRKIIVIGDLKAVPSINPGKRVDLLLHHSREEISHSRVLVNLVKSERVSLDKKTVYTSRLITPHTIDYAITPAEENEIVENYKQSIHTKTASYTLILIDDIVVFNGASLTATLPTAVGKQGIIYTIKNINSSNLTIETTGSQTIDGESTQTVTQWAAITVVSNDTNWLII